MNLVFNGMCGREPEYGSTEHLFVLACTYEVPELWAEFNDMSEDEVRQIVRSLIHLGWGFEFVTLH